MIFVETKIKGAYLIQPEPVQDDRGSFARAFCKREFESRGLNGIFVQCNTSYNRKKGTLRGMHYQAPPHQEVKLVWCIRGSIYDVIVDLRKESGPFRNWFAVELSADNGEMLYIPKGVAHGFQTLEDHTEVYYQMSEFYHSESARGVRWDDPALGIEWPPISDRMVSDKDAGFLLTGKT